MLQLHRPLKSKGKYSFFFKKMFNTRAIVLAKFGKTRSMCRTVVQTAIKSTFCPATPQLPKDVDLIESYWKPACNNKNPIDHGFSIVQFFTIVPANMEVIGNTQVKFSIFN